MLLAEVKKQTNHHHQELEDKLGAILFDPNLDERQYHDILMKFLHAYKQLESAAAQFNLPSELLIERSKTGAIEKDIACLGSQYPDHHEKESLQSVENQYEALGVLYVMEGATLGGKYIVNHLHKIPWVLEKKCTNFFYSYGDKRGDMWKSFIEIVENETSDNPKHFDLFMIGVNKTFTYLNDIF